MIDFKRLLTGLVEEILLIERRKQVAMSNQPTTAQLAILNKMSGMTGSFNKARTLKNPFGQTKLDVGDYIFQLTRASLSEFGEAGKAKAPGVIFIFVCQCRFEDGSTEECFGQQVRVTRKFASSKNGGTVDEAIERFVYDLQDLGVETDKLILLGEPNVNEGEFTLLQLLSWFTETGIYVKGSIVESEPNDKGQRYKNLQSISRLSNLQLLEKLGEGNFSPVDDGSNDLSTQTITDTSAPEDAALAEADYNPDGDEGVTTGPPEMYAAIPENWFVHADANYCAGMLEDGVTAAYWNEAGEMVEFDSAGNVTVLQPAPFSAEPEYVPYEPPVVAKQPPTQASAPPTKTVGPPRQPPKPPVQPSSLPAGGKPPHQPSPPTQRPVAQQPSAPAGPAGTTTRVAPPRPQPGAGLPPGRRGPPQRK